MFQYIRNHSDKFIKLLWLGTILVCIKSILTDTGFDNSYAVAMSYRHLNGDAMMQAMWELHQTSIYVTDILMWLYHLIVPSYTGVMLYLQTCGTLLFVLLGYYLYRMLREYTGKEVGQLVWMFFILFRVKQSPFPDYANLQVAFSLLIILFLLRFFENQDHVSYLLAAAVCLCLGVIAYPSGVLIYLAVCVLLFWKTEKKWKNVGILTGTCALLGSCYVGYFVWKLGLGGLLDRIGNIIGIDTHGGENSGWYTSYLFDFFLAAGWVLCCIAIAWLIKKLLSKKKTVDLLPLTGLLLVVSEVAMLLLRRKTGLDWTTTFFIVPLFLILLGAGKYSKLTDKEKTVWVTGLLISCSCFAATLIFSDLAFITILAYLVLGGAFSFVAIRHYEGNALVFLMAIVTLVMFHRGLVVWGYANKSDDWLVYEVESIVRSGPTVGVVCDYMTSVQIRDGARDHATYLGPDDSVLLVGWWIMDSTEYLLLNGADICNPTVIDTPIFNENLLTYQEVNPDKVPNVVAVSCWFGNLMVDPNSWIMNWVEENYEPVGDGSYWRYYRIK